MKKKFEKLENTPNKKTRLIGDSNLRKQETRAARDKIYRDTDSYIDNYINSSQNEKVTSEDIRQWKNENRILSQDDGYLTENLEYNFQIIRLKALRMPGDQGPHGEPNPNWRDDEKLKQWKVCIGNEEFDMKNRPWSYAISKGWYKSNLALAQGYASAMEKCYPRTIQQKIIQDLDIKNRYNKKDFEILMENWNDYHKRKIGVTNIYELVSQFEADKVQIAAKAFLADVSLDSDKAKILERTQEQISKLDNFYCMTENEELNVKLAHVRAFLEFEDEIKGWEINIKTIDTKGKKKAEEEEIINYEEWSNELDDTKSNTEGWEPNGPWTKMIESDYEQIIANAQADRKAIQETNNNNPELVTKLDMLSSSYSYRSPLNRDELQNTNTMIDTSMRIYKCFNDEIGIRSIKSNLVEFIKAAKEIKSSYTRENNLEKNVLELLDTILSPLEKLSQGMHTYEPSVSKEPERTKKIRKVTNMDLEAKHVSELSLVYADRIKEFSSQSLDKTPNDTSTRELHRAADDLIKYYSKNNYKGIAECLKKLDHISNSKKDNELKCYFGNLMRSIEQHMKTTANEQPSVKELSNLDDAINETRDTFEKLNLEDQLKVADLALSESDNEIAIGFFQSLKNRAMILEGKDDKIDEDTQKILKEVSENTSELWELTSKYIQEANPQINEAIEKLKKLINTFSSSIS